jgi:predicted nucleic acid-binding protein
MLFGVPSRPEVVSNPATRSQKSGRSARDSGTLSSVNRVNVRLILDANILVALAIPTAASAKAAKWMDDWLASKQEFFAPALWSYEAVSSIRKYVSAGLIDSQEAYTAVDRLLTLGVQDVAPSVTLQRRALQWAERLSGFVAYDAAYLAVAEELQAPFWTTDGKLVKKARGLGVDWIFNLTESDQ